MANENKQTNAQAVEAVLNDMKIRAEDAHKRGDVFMMGFYTELLKAISPSVKKAIAREHREQLADINKKHKELKQSNPKMPTSGSSNGPTTSTRSSNP